MKILGEGRNWIVYENPKNHREVIKIPKNDITGNKISQNIKNFNLICDTFETVKYIIQDYWMNRKVIITENLNSIDFVYVSPNSYKTEKQILLNKSNSHSKTLMNQSIEEQKLGDYKIENIESLKLFLNDVLTKLIHISSQNIRVEFDSYFFGVVRNSKSSIIKCKIADFDNIYENSGNCLRDNIE